MSLRSRLAIIILIILLIGVGFILVIHKKPSTQQTPVFTGPANQSSSKSDKTTNPSTSSAGAPGNSNSVSSNSTLSNPTGNFVSNHHVSLSDNSATSQEQSVCNVPPGTACVIHFTNNGGTKSLQTKITDSTGAVYWLWRPQDLGLYTGSWQITAIATLNGQTKTSTDAQPLNVTP